MALVIDGNSISRGILDNLRLRVATLKEEIPWFLPCLTIVQVGDLQESNVYIGKKVKAAKSIGIKVNHVKLPKSASQNEILVILEMLNSDPTVHGIIVQLPLDTDRDIDTHIIINSISPRKDVDGLTAINAGLLAQGDLSRCIPPCTPNGCMELLRASGIQVMGKRAVVVGRSKIVGAPMAALLTWNNASVTVCHSKTVNLQNVCKEADVLVVAIGKPQMITRDCIKPGAVVIDCGINSIPAKNTKSGRRIVGDVDYESAEKVAGAITPVPGGVGPMTVAMLLKNTFENSRYLCQKRGFSTVTQLKSLKQQVPLDVCIPKYQARKDISVMAGEYGKLSRDAEQYKKKTAQVLISNFSRLDGRINSNIAVNRKITTTLIGGGKPTTTTGISQALGSTATRNFFTLIAQSSPGANICIRKIILSLSRF